MDQIDLFLRPTGGYEMRYSVVVRVIGIILLFGLLCGCQNANEMDYTFPPIQLVDYSNQFDYPYPCYTTLEAYEQLLEESYIPEGYVSYSDIAFIGKFDEYMLHHNEANGIEALHDKASFVLRDSSRRYIHVTVRKRTNDNPLVKDLLEMETYGKLDDCDDLRYAPEFFEDSRSYLLGDVRYTYLHMRKGEKPAVLLIQWYYGDYYVRIAPNPIGDIANWSVYPEEATDTFVGRLLNPETAQGAVNQLNSVIWWVSFRDRLIQWLPVIIPVLCIVAAGTVYLIIRRKRKKAATKATHETEPKTEE